jgi:hypothetical protein
MVSRKSWNVAVIFWSCARIAPEKSLDGYAAMPRRTGDIEAEALFKPSVFGTGTPPWLEIISTADCLAV